MKAALIATATLALTLAVGATPAAGAGEENLSALINRELRSGGSWFTPEERRVIERKCGYAPGEWDGFEANLSDGRFTCRNGRVVEGDAEMTALLRAAEPRIEARVAKVMASAGVKAAISRVAATAAAEAMGEVEALRRR
ncbi:MAG: hypothetical protein QOJ27_727 [Sphingomonadales bacterium]|nr:hypothetical protein [Sphingomonadales bacterium]